MANGSKLLAEYKRKSDAGETIPQAVTNAIVFEALIELYGFVDKVSCLLDQIQSDEKIRREQSKDFINGRTLWENYGREIVKYLIVIVLGYVAIKLGLIK